MSSLNKNNFSSAVSKDRPTRITISKGAVAKQPEYLVSLKRKPSAPAKRGKDNSKKSKDLHISDDEEEDPIKDTQQSIDDSPPVEKDEVLVVSTQLDESLAKRFRVDRPPIDTESQLPSEKTAKIVIDLMSQGELSQEMNNSSAAVTDTPATISPHPMILPPPPSPILSCLDTQNSQKDDDIPMSTILEMISNSSEPIKLNSVAVKEVAANNDEFWKVEVERIEKTMKEELDKDFKLVYDVMYRKMKDQFSKYSTTFKNSIQKKYEADNAAVLEAEVKKLNEKLEKVGTEMTTWIGLLEEEKKKNRVLEESLKKHKLALKAFVDQDL